eukprot:15455316-Alexandrium_andersonii.AAC.1
MEASGAPVGQAGQNLLESPRRRDLARCVLEGRDHQGGGHPIVMSGGECAAERLGVRLPWRRARGFRAQRRVEALARNEVNIHEEHQACPGRSEGYIAQGVDGVEEVIGRAPHLVLRELVDQRD